MKRWLLIFLLSALLLLAGCGGTASDGASSDAVDGEANDAAASQVLTEGAEALTDDELAQAQEAFASERYDEATGANSSTEVSCFFTSYYDRAEELSLAEFLRYYPNDELLRVDNAEDQAQFEALVQLDDFPFQAEEDFMPSLTSIPTPTRRYPRAAVDATLQKYAGITTADLTNTEGVLYLPEYDAYYNFTSDWGPGMFQPDGGEKLGNTVRFWTQEGSSRNYTVLTLENVDDTWLIRSFRPETIG